MSSAARSIATLLIGTGALFLGNGLLQTLLPIRAQLEAFSTSAIGLMGAIYFAGFAVGCLVGPAAVKKVGHIRCFAGFAALAAAAMLVFPIAVNPLAWSILRGFTGLCLAVLYMVVESWLNDQSSNEVRGGVLSVYIIVSNVVTMGGQLMVNIDEPTGWLLFSLVAMLVGLSLVPLSLTDTAAPKPIATAELRIARLFRYSPAGFVGCLAVGMVEGAFWTLGPVFAQGRALPVAEIALFMGAFVAGGTLSQWPLGRLSDHVDRRWVMAGCSLGTVGTGLALAFLAPDSTALAFALACLHGAFMVPLYALCLAHANDYAPNERLVETSSGLLLVYAAGAVTGPLAIGPAMERFGPGGLFLAMAVILGLFALFLLARMLVRPIAAAGERVEFVPVPKTTPSVYALETDD
ncbi:MAG: MFS transporter [Rhodospirillales bacterium]|nr:MFS transporter [Rhodospirillales bacterium]MDH3916898.1 MFS transporter [Rhodospirillales bacterium]MDH3966987.1 MFS transporter [Rhodospirillales bacterium]